MADSIIDVSNNLSFQSGGQEVARIDSSGNITGTNNYTLPIATTSTLGGVKPDGETTEVDANGVLSVIGGGGTPYTAGSAIEIANDNTLNVRAKKAGYGSTYTQFLNTDMGGGITFNPDGTKVFQSVTWDNLTVTQENYIYQWTLSTPYDLTTAGTGTGFYDSSVVNELASMFFSDDGTKMYSIYTDASSNPFIRQYTLSTAWDVTTAVYADKTITLTEFGSMFICHSQFLNNGATVIFVIGDVGAIVPFNLSTPYDITTAVINASGVVNIGIAGISSFAFNETGTSALLSRSNTQKPTIYSINFSTPYNITTANGLSEVYKFSPEGSMWIAIGKVLGNSIYCYYDVWANGSPEVLGIAKFTYAETYQSGFLMLNSNGYAYNGDFSVNTADGMGTAGIVKIYNGTDNGIAVNDGELYTRNASTTQSGCVKIDGTTITSTGGVISAVIPESSGGNSVENFGDYTSSGMYGFARTYSGIVANCENFKFTEDGTKMYTSVNNIIYKYELGEAFNLASVISSQTCTLPTDYIIKDVHFNKSGTYVIACGTNTSYTHKYFFRLTLSTAHDLNTATYDTFGVGTGVTNERVNTADAIWLTEEGKYLIYGCNGNLIKVTMQYGIYLWSYSYWTEGTAYSVNNTTNPIRGLYADKFGTNLFVSVPASSVMIHYTLSIPWDLSTRTQADSQNITAYGLALNKDSVTRHMYTKTSATTYDFYEWNFQGGFNDLDALVGCTYSGDMYNVQLDNTLELTDGVLGVNRDEFNYTSGDNIQIKDKNISFLTPNGWDASNMEYLNTTNMARNSIFGINFSDDGYKLYTMSADSGYLNEYNLTTPYNVTTATYLQYYDVAFYYNISFNNDGTKMYGTHYDGSVYCYNLMIPYDITSVSTSATTSVSAYHGLTFSPDGKYMFVSSSSGTIYKYTLSTPWSLTTKTSNGSATIHGGQNIVFNPNGTILYTIDSSGVIYKHTLSTAWDISTLTYIESYTSGHNAYALYIDSTGRKLYLGDGSSNIYQYNLGIAGSVVCDENGKLYISEAGGLTFNTAWDITLVPSTPNNYGTYGVTDGTLVGMAWKPDGINITTMNSDGHLYDYTLGTAWLIGGSSNGYERLQTVGKYGLQYSSNGMYIYVSDDTTIYQYNSNSAYVSPMSGSYYKSIAVNGSATFRFSADGTKLFTMDSANNYTVYKYTLSTAWDVSTATLTTSYPNMYVPFDSFEFNSDGTVMFMIISNEIWKSNMSTPWDLSTMTGIGDYSKIDGKFGLSFSPDGSKVFCISSNVSTPSTINRYNLTGGLIQYNNGTLDLVGTASLGGGSTYTEGTGIDITSGVISIDSASSPTLTGLTLSGTTATTVPYLDASKKLTSSSVTPTELGYVSGVSSSIQTQLNGKSPIAGSTSITTLGTIGTGSWNATAIPYNKGGTGLTSVALGQIPYGASGTAWSALAGNTTTTKKFLTQTGTGSVSAVPAWGTIADTDLPTATTSTLGGVKVDNSTIMISSGVISAPGSISGTNFSQYMADMYINNTATTVSCATAGTWYAFSSANFTNSKSSGATHSSGTLTVTVAGTYKIDYSASAYCTTATKSIGIGIMKGSSILNNAKTRTLEATASGYYALSGSCLVDLVVGDTIKLATTNYTTASMTNGVIDASVVMVRMY